MLTSELLVVLMPVCVTSFLRLKQESSAGKHVAQVQPHLCSCQIPGKLLQNDVLILDVSATTVKD